MEPLTIAIGIGLVVSLAFGELFSVTAGGMIVPGYFAMFITKPVDIIATLAVALVTFALVRSISNIAVVYGRRRTVMAVLIGYLVGMSMRWLTTEGVMFTDEAQVIGFIIPGIIAIWIERQGIVETITTLLTASVIVRLLLIILAVI
ncbi:MAG: poly-gamma-glutamate biosynthesis protein PgsC [Myxococcota bacterium]